MRSRKGEPRLTAFWRWGRFPPPLGPCAGAKSEHPYGPRWRRSGSLKGLKRWLGHLTSAYAGGVAVLPDSKWERRSLVLQVSFLCRSLCWIAVGGVSWYGACIIFWRLNSVNTRSVEEAAWLPKGPCSCHRGSLPSAASSSMFRCLPELQGCPSHSRWEVQWGAWDPSLNLDLQTATAHLLQAARAVGEAFHFVLLDASPVFSPEPVRHPCSSGEHEGGGWLLCRDLEGAAFPWHPQGSVPWCCGCPGASRFYVVAWICWFAGLQNVEMLMHSLFIDSLSLPSENKGL